MEGELQNNQVNQPREDKEEEEDERCIKAVRYIYKEDELKHIVK